MIPARPQSSKCLAVSGALITFLVAIISAHGAPPTETPVKEAKETGPSPFAKGPITKLDLATKQVTLKLKSGPRTFTLTERTYIFRGKDKITAEKLTVGEIIALSFYSDKEGRVLVRRIKASEIPSNSDADSKPKPANP